jgi:hypothetical protein
MIVISKDHMNGEVLNTVTHEIMHIMAHRSGVFQDSQEKHDDKHIWGVNGVLDLTNQDLGLHHD